MTISALIVEDEPPARDRLREMLGDHPDVVITAEVGSVPAAMAEVVRDRPDLIFLDIALPGDGGLTLVDLIGRGRGRGGGRSPAVVCVTAYADHAVRAFDAAVVDYLLKPFSRERLADSLARVREHLHAASVARLRTRRRGEYGGSRSRCRVASGSLMSAASTAFGPNGTTSASSRATSGSWCG